MKKQLLTTFKKSSGIALSERSESKGFTLVELMVVISIIAILAVVGLTLYNNTQKGARDSKRVQDIKAIANALEVNYKSTGQNYEALANNMFASGVQPKDPQDSTSPYYVSQTGTPTYQSYNVCATQETGTTSFCLKNQR